jgi:hypothetical protein
MLYALMYSLVNLKSVHLKSVHAMLCYDFAPRLDRSVVPCSDNLCVACYDLPCCPAICNHLSATQSTAPQQLGHGICLSVQPWLTSTACLCSGHLHPLSVCAIVLDIHCLSVQTSLTSYGVSTSSISVVSAVAAAKTADTSDCTSGAINGICIGMVFLCVRSVYHTCYRLVTAFTAASA